MTYKLRIDNWHPARTNQLMRHWAAAARLKKIDSNMVAGYCTYNRIPIAQGPREVSLLITLGPKCRGTDTDAFWKSTLDALVNARMLIDDCRKYCRTGSVDIVRGTAKSTTITLEDIGP